MTCNILDNYCLCNGMKTSTLCKTFANFCTPRPFSKHFNDPTIPEVSKVPQAGRRTENRTVKEHRRLRKKKLYWEDRCTNLSQIQKSVKQSRVSFLIECKSEEKLTNGGGKSKHKPLMKQQFKMEIMQEKCRPGDNLSISFFSVSFSKEHDIRHPLFKTHSSTWLTFTHKLKGKKMSPNQLSTAFSNNRVSTYKSQCRVSV